MQPKGPPHVFSRFQVLQGYTLGETKTKQKRNKNIKHKIFANSYKQSKFQIYPASVSNPSGWKLGTEFVVDLLVFRPKIKRTNPL